MDVAITTESYLVGGPDRSKPVAGLEAKGNARRSTHRQSLSLSLSLPTGSSTLHVQSIGGSASSVSS